jgi:fructokinase
MKLNVVAVGEVLWDLLPSGPELGGAPANFAYHAHALGASSQVITRVGNDDFGREILRRFREMGLPDSNVQTDDAEPTGTARVELSGDGLAHFVIQENVAWDRIALTLEARAVAGSADAICFGSLAQRSKISRNVIQQLIAAAPAEAPRVFDVNLREPFYSRRVIQESLLLANVVKLNDDELPILANMFDLAESTLNHSNGADSAFREENNVGAEMRTRVSAPYRIQHQIERMATMFNLRLVALTRGANGSLLYEREDKRWSDCASRPVKVVDTVGAGDSFTAALVMGLLHQIDLDEINSIANEVARYVCSQAGGTPRLPAEFGRRFQQLFE